MRNEDHFFFQNTEGRRLFGILHGIHEESTNIEASTAIVYCHPIFEERLWSYRISVDFARYANMQGYDVFRFDYFGDGESEGLFEEASISSRITDIVSAVEFIKRRKNPSRIYLMGLRVGASLCMLAGKETDLITGMILWEPVMDLKHYFYDMLRGNLVSQMVTYTKTRLDREALIKKIESGELINLDGYKIGNPLWSEASEVNLLEKTRLISKPSLMVKIGSTDDADGSYQSFIENQQMNMVSYAEIEERHFWFALEVLFPSCEALFSTSVEWIALQHDQIQ